MAEKHRRKQTEVVEFFRLRVPPIRTTGGSLMAFGFHCGSIPRGGLESSRRHPRCLFGALVFVTSHAHMLSGTTVLALSSTKNPIYPDS